MPIYIDPKATARFTFKADRGEDGEPLPGAPVFLLGQPTLAERDEIERLLMEGGNDPLALMRAVIRGTLRGWDGWDAPYSEEDGRPTDESYMAFTLPDRTELMQAGLEHMGLSVSDQD